MLGLPAGTRLVLLRHDVEWLAVTIQYWEVCHLYRLNSLCLLELLCLTRTTPSSSMLSLHIQFRTMLQVVFMIGVTSL